MEQGIKFVITGDTKGLGQATKKAEKEIEGLGDSVDTASGKVDKGSDSVEGMGEAAKKTGTETKSLAGELEDMAVKAATVASILEFARVVFTQLEEDTGFLSEAITGLSVQEQRAAETQRELNKAIGEGIGTAKSEITQLQSLISIAQDEANARETRQAAVNKINEEYPDFIDNLKLEEVNTINIREAVDSLTKSYIRQAQIKPLLDGLSEAIGKQEELLRTSGEEAATFSDKFVARMNPVLAITGRTTERIEELGEMRKFLDFTALDKDIKQFTDRINELNKAELEEFGFQSDSGKTSKDLEKLRKDFVSTQQKITKAQQRENAKRAAELERELNRQAAIQKRVTAQLWRDEQDAAELAANEIKTDIAEIYRDSGAQALDLGIAENIRQEADASEAPIKKLESSLEGLQDVLKRFDLSDIDLSGLSSQQLDALGTKLENLTFQSEIFGNAIQSAFSGAAKEISDALETGNAIIDGFVSSIINSLATLAASYLANELFGKALAQKLILTEQAKSNANAITIASSAAAAAGPLGIGLFPGFLATMLAQINGAFAGVQALGAFAQGGIIGGGSFTGDNVLIRANSGERILTTQDQSLLTRFLRGETTGSMNQTGGLPNLEASTVLRGSDIYLSWKRADRNNNRFF